MVPDGVHQAPQFILAGTQKACDLCMVKNTYKRRHGLYIENLRYALAFVDVHAQKPNVGIRGSELFNDRGNDLARAAPRRRELDYAAMW
jgi:hypothetical protein